MEMFQPNSAKAGIYSSAITGAEAWAWLAPG